MALGPAMAQGGATLGCCQLGTAAWRDKVSHSPLNDGGGGVGCLSILLCHVTTACLLPKGCASAALLGVFSPLLSAQICLSATAGGGAVTF